MMLLGNTADLLHSNAIFDGGAEPPVDQDGFFGKTDQTFGDTEGRFGEE